MLPSMIEDKHENNKAMFPTEVEYGCKRRAALHAVGVSLLPPGTPAPLHGVFSQRFPPPLAWPVPGIATELDEDVDRADAAVDEVLADDVGGPAVSPRLASCSFLSRASSAISRLSLGDLPSQRWAGYSGGRMEPLWGFLYNRFPKTS